MASPLNQSLDTLQPSSIGCISCDARSLDLLKPELINNFINRKQLSWKWNSDEKGGFFELERRFLFDFETHFPSCEGAARASSNQLIQKLNFYRKHASPCIARETSFKLSKGFLQNKSQWANIDELTSSPHTFLPLLVVVPHLGTLLAVVLRSLTPHLTGDNSCHLGTGFSKNKLEVV